MQILPFSQSSLRSIGAALTEFKQITILEKDECPFDNARFPDSNTPESWASEFMILP